MAVRRRLGGLLALVLVATTALAACDPPAGSGLTMKAQTPTTGLNPGDTVEVRVAGARANQRVLLFQCIVDDCLPMASKPAVANKDGAVTVRWTVQATAGATTSDWPYPARYEACRAPTTCRLYVGTGVGPDGPVGVAATSIPLQLTGRQVRFTATPTSGLRGGERITVTGTAPGAAGRRVRIARMDHFIARNEESLTKVGASVYATVRPDGSFSGTYVLPADPAAADCSDGEPTRVCEITAWVGKADRSAIDPSFGKPMIALVFA